MSLLNYCGFETADLTTETAVFSGSPTLQSTVTHAGEYALRSNNLAAEVHLRGLASDGKVAELGRTAATYYSFYIRIDTLPSGDAAPARVDSSGGTTVGQVNISSAGAVTATGTGNSASAGTITAGSGWHRIDLMILSNGTSSISLDGGSAQTFTGVNATQDRIKLGSQTASGQDWYIDDVFIDDAGFTTAVSIVRLDVDGNGTDTGWTGDVTAVDEIPHDSGSTVINSTSTSAAETFTLESVATAGAQAPFSVKQGAVMAESSSTTTLAGLRLRSGANTSDTTAVDVGTTAYVLFARVFNLNPDGSVAWTDTSVDAVEAGVKKGNDADDVRCTSVWVMVASTSGVRPSPATLTITGEDISLGSEVWSIYDGTGGVTWRKSDASNFWCCYIDAPNTRFVVSKFVATVETEVDEYLGAILDTHEIRVITQGNRHRVRIDYVLRFDFEDAFNNTATKHGLYAKDQDDWNYDDVYMEQV